MPYDLSYKIINPITVCARASNLSISQVNEVLLSIQKYYPNITFKLTTFLSPGDLDLLTPLTSPKIPNNFFTKNLDEYILQGKYHIAIHSAKDVPIPMNPNLELIALTKSISEIDCLLFQDKKFITLPQSNVLIGTSSQRRAQTIQTLFPKWKTKDIRGNIEERISMINKKIINGIVIAKAALIRLNLLNKYFTIDLPPPYARFQGSLAIIAKKHSFIIKKIFSKININKDENLFFRIE